MAADTATPEVSPTDTLTPTAVFTATETLTPTMTETPGPTDIPTEEPPAALEEAQYIYDGDGKLIKTIINDVVTVYVGRHYNKNMDTLTVQKHYFIGGITVAVDTGGTLQWVLSDHLGSAGVTANADGTWNSEIMYTAFGEVRASSGLTTTGYRCLYTAEHWEENNESIDIFFLQSSKLFDRTLPLQV
ncbi:MAG: hypothetical protein JEZ06_21720 [Anaerolineaceae bacterium]|nr:hypothetical protein [Anaerolineaceae bacterium]